MRKRRSLHLFLPKLPPFSVIVFLLCSSWATLPLSAQAGSRTSPDTGGRPARSSKKPPQAARPDPRYRPATDFAELQAVAGVVAKASGRKIRWHLELGKDPGPLATIRGGLDDCTISIHPVAARKVPPNTWAFIFGHEFAHLTGNLGTHSLTNPANELKADIAGARYAMAAGYRIEAFLGWVLNEQNQTSDTHGSLHHRVKSIATHFGVPQNAIQAQARRHAGYQVKR